MATMIAARVHKQDEPMKLDRIPIPEPRSTDVLVEVKACGIVPNLARVIANAYKNPAAGTTRLLPQLPAIFGLDPAGVIAKVGDQVRSVRPGDRVYVNPARKCGSCRMCRSGQPLDCPEFTFQGYFGRSHKIMKAYPYGGLCQFITAPEDALVKLPDNVSFEVAARFGYLGTAYSAMRTLDVGPGRTLLVNGVSGMLGLNAVMLALAMGVTRILGIGRNKALLDRVRALSPQRIEVYSVDESMPVGPADPLVAWVKSMTEGYGVDSSLDCLPPGASGDAFMRPLFTLRRGGRAVTVGGVRETVSLNTFWLMTNRFGLQGSVWFTTGEGQDMAEMVAAGTLDVSPLEHRIFPLSQVNDAMAGLNDRNGGFTNFIVDPTQAE